jgi:2-aminoadipate transaminase
VLLRFAQSGRFDAHLEKVRAAGAQRLDAVLNACRQHLPARATFTSPQGGMSLWVSLPEPLDAAELLPRAQRENVNYLPGKLFAVSNYAPGTLRLSFGGLTPAQIETGVAKLGRIFTEELARVRTSRETEAESALV